MHLIYNAVYIIRTRREPVQPHLGSVLPGPEPVRQHANPRRALYSTLPFRSNRQSSSAQSTAEYNRKCHSDWSINAHEVRPQLYIWIKSIFGNKLLYYYLYPISQCIRFVLRQGPHRAILSEHNHLEYRRQSVLRRSGWFVRIARF